MSISASLLPVSTGSGLVDSALAAVWVGKGLLPVAATTPGMTTVGTPDRAESDNIRYIHRPLAPLFSLPTSNFLMPISIGRHSPIDNKYELEIETCYHLIRIKFSPERVNENPSANPSFSPIFFIVMVTTSGLESSTYQ